MHQPSSGAPTTVSETLFVLASFAHSSHCPEFHFSDCEEWGVRNVFSEAIAEKKTSRTLRACVAGGGGHAA
jgi:hypothetical protein